MPTPPATQAIYEAAAGLSGLLDQLKAFRARLTRIVLPIAAANDRLDHSDDMAAILESQLLRAWTINQDEIERIEEAEEVEYARAHGLTALAAANDDAALAESV